MSRTEQSGLGACLIVSLVACLRAGTPDEQIKEYEAEAVKTIVELQQFRETTSVKLKTASGREGVATLTNLNPVINVAYLLKVAWKGVSSEVYHLENPKPQTRKLVLDDKNPSGLVIVEGTNRYFCDLFGARALEQASASSLIFHRLCEGRIYLRKSATGHRTTLEATTEFLREHVWGGERIIALGHILLGDRHLETGRIEPQTGAAAGAKRGGGADDFPLAALIDSKYADRMLSSSSLGIDVEGPDRTGMTPGTWYAASGNPGVYVSILQPNLIDPPILQSYRTAVNSLDNIESSALCYMIAFDLDRFELGYALGTEHPKVGWSDRTLEKMKDPKLPGPDGIGSIQPLIATGLVRAENAQITVATFTGGFKRAHGAFRYGELALRNHGSYYGFIENGVVFSKLQPGLATIVVLDDGSVEMKTWNETDNTRLARIRHARQNGVPIIELDNSSRLPAPSALVRQWGAGNWSGSEDGKLRALRSGAAVQRGRGKRFLIYAVFSGATPSAMARIFQAYQCDYAMLLDMNALEHTYMAVYRRSGSQMFVDHLMKGMGVLERSVAGKLVPRFLGYADNRDFFYVMRRSGNGVKP